MIKNYFFLAAVFYGQMLSPQTEQRQTMVNTVHNKIQQSINILKKYAKQYGPTVIKKSLCIAIPVLITGRILYMAASSQFTKYYQIPFWKYMATAIKNRLPSKGTLRNVAVHTITGITNLGYKTAIIMRDALMKATI